MSTWKAVKARRVYAALLRIGWEFGKQVGSHRKLVRSGWRNFTFSFHDGDEVGPAALARIAKDTGLKPEDLDRRGLLHLGNGLREDAAGEHLDIGIELWNGSS